MNEAYRKAFPKIVAYGGGVNSTAMLIGMKDRGIKPDLILMSNTGAEMPETLRWLTTFAAWLNDSGMPKLIVIAKDGGQYLTLEERCIGRNEMPSLAYGFKTCSSMYKRDPQKKFCNNWQPAKDCWAAGGKCIKYIGYDADEERRATLVEDKKYDFAYPLIEWGWGRDECVQAIVKEGLPVPPKSSCFFCPSTRKADVLKLKQQHPDLFARAVHLEKLDRERCKADGKHVGSNGLGRNWSWESLGKADDAQMSLAGFLDPQEEPCGCYDGDYDGIDETVVELSITAGCKKK